MLLCSLPNSNYFQPRTTLHSLGRDKSAEESKAPNTMFLHTEQQGKHAIDLNTYIKMYDISMVQNISDESHVANHKYVKFQFFNEILFFSGNNSSIK